MQKKILVVLSLLHFSFCNGALEEQMPDVWRSLSRIDLKPADQAMLYCYLAEDTAEGRTEYLRRLYEAEFDVLKAIKRPGDFERMKELINILQKQWDLEIAAEEELEKRLEKQRAEELVEAQKLLSDIPLTHKDKSLLFGYFSRSDLKRAQYLSAYKEWYASTFQRLQYLLDMIKQKQEPKVTEEELIYDQQEECVYARQEQEKFDREIEEATMVIEKKEQEFFHQIEIARRVLHAKQAAKEAVKETKRIALSRNKSYCIVGKYAAKTL